MDPGSRSMDQFIRAKYERKQYAKDSNTPDPRQLNPIKSSAANATDNQLVDPFGTFSEKKTTKPQTSSSQQLFDAFNQPTQSSSAVKDSILSLYGKPPSSSRPQNMQFADFSNFQPSTTKSPAADPFASLSIKESPAVNTAAFDPFGSMSKTLMADLQPTSNHSQTSSNMKQTNNFTTSSIPMSSFGDIKPSNPSSSNPFANINNSSNNSAYYDVSPIRFQPTQSNLVMQADLPKGNDEFGEFVSSNPSSPRISAAVKKSSLTEFSLTPQAETSKIQSEPTEFSRNTPPSTKSGISDFQYGLNDPRGPLYSQTNHLSKSAAIPGFDNPWPGTTESFNDFGNDSSLPSTKNTFQPNELLYNSSESKKNHFEPPVVDDWA